MIIEEGKAAKRSDSFLDFISKQKSKHDEQIASLEFRVTYAYIVIQQLAQTCTPDQAEILLDLCKVLHGGLTDDNQT